MDLKEVLLQYNNKLNSFLTNLQNYVEVDETPIEEPEPVSIGKAKRPSIPMDGTQSAAVKTRSPSINYSLKDLQNLKKRPSTDSTVSNITSTTTSSEAATSLASTNSTSKTITVESSVSKSDLPPNWKEMIDPKTNRPYYVNK